MHKELKGLMMPAIKCIIVCIIVFILNINLEAQDKKYHSFDSTNYSIEDCVNEFSMEGTEKTKAGYQYWFVEKDFLDGRTIKLSVVAPDSSTHSPHSHSEDEFFFILEGTAEFYLNAKTKEVGPMTSLYCPPFTKHGIRNIGNTELKYLVIKKYEVSIGR